MRKKTKEKMIEELVKTVRSDSIRIAKEEVIKNLQALQAIDVGYRETGKVIIIARVGGHDHVEIIDVPKEWSIYEYRSLCDMIKTNYGATVEYCDCPHGINPFMDFVERSRA